MRLLAFFIFCFSAPATAQQAFQKRSSVVSAGAGVYNIWKQFLRDAISYPPSTYKVSATGPFTIIYEYGVTNRFSAGVALGYSEINGKFNGFGEKFDEKLTNFSALIRANFHVGKFKKVDPYFGGGAGYFAFKYENSRNLSGDGKIPSALGLSAQVGVKYYFKPSIGAYAEIGYVGGSIGQLGMAAKF